MVDYLNHPPSKKELKELIRMLGIRPEELLRKKEPVFEAHYKGKKLTDAGWIDAMVKFPVLIERPIVIQGDRAIVARPEEKLAEFIK